LSVYLPWFKDTATGRRRQSKVYWYDFTYCGQRIRESAKTTRRSAAENAEYERRKSLENSVVGGKVKVIRQKRLRRVKQALADYQKAYAVNHRLKGVQLIQERAPHLLRHLGDAIAVDLTPEKILDYMTTRKAEGVSNRTVNMEIAVLSWAMGMRFDVKKLEEAHDVGHALSREEEMPLIDAAAKSNSKVLHTIVRIALANGMRRDEIRLLRIFQIDFVFTVGKTKPGAGEGRVIPIGPALERMLQTYLNVYAQQLGAAQQQDWYLFPFSNRRKLIDPTRPIGSFRKAWESARKEANIQCRFHDLRYTCCTKMAEAGVPESTMKAIMGHMSQAMLERYSHIRMHAKREAILAVEAQSAVSFGRPQTERDAIVAVERQSLESHGKESPKVNDFAPKETLQ
jgi:integrase